MEAIKFVNQNQNKSSWQKILISLHIDWPLMLGVLALSIFGSIILYSAANGSVSVLTHQIMLLSFGFILMITCAQIPPHYYEIITPWLFASTLLMLLLVLALGIVGKGAQRWLGVGGIRFQPAEIMKIALPMTLAWYLKYKKLPPKFKTIAIAALLIFIPAILVAKQPDLGTAILIAAAGCAVLLISGINLKLVLSAAFALLLSAPLLWHFIHDYQKQRILTFFNPEKDPLGAGYHIIQSKIAIGSGGFFGKGFMQGTQTHLQFLPEHSTDFIFAVIGEELGLTGCALLIFIMCYITWRAIYISTHAQDTYTRLLAGSLSITFFLAFFINIGMVIGILPVVGLPLPLISYGGSSIITLMVLFGILMSIHTHRSLLPA